MELKEGPMPEGVPQWMRDKLARVGLTTNIIRTSELNDEQRDALTSVAAMLMLIDKGIIGVTTENGFPVFHILGVPESEILHVLQIAILDWLESSPSPQYSGIPAERRKIQTTLYDHAHNPEEEDR